MKYARISLAGVMASALVLGAVAFMPVHNASAQQQEVQGRIGAYDPISSWIVLDSLFNPGYGYGYRGYGYGMGYNPVASWIVLDGLFGPGRVQ